MPDPFPSIGIVIPWFGPWSPWTEYFLLSCRANPSVHWILISDQPSPANIPDNVRHIPMKIAEWVRMAEKKLNCRICLNHPYKICDLKPAYGYIFSEYLQEYAFWGYGDMDLVYGNFRRLLSGSEMDSADVISTHTGFIPAHFCLLRNTPEISRLFMLGGRYKQAFAHPDYLGFDEQLLKFPVRTSSETIEKDKIFIQQRDQKLSRLTRSKWIYPLKIISKQLINPFRTNRNHIPGDFNTILRLHHAKKDIKISYKTRFECDNMYKKQGITNWKIKWEKGNLFSENTGEKRDLLYFHFMLSKQNQNFKIHKPGNLTDEFIISPEGIRPGSL